VIKDTGNPGRFDGTELLAEIVELSGWRGLSGRGGEHFWRWAKGPVDAVFAHKGWLADRGKR